MSLRGVLAGLTGQECGVHQRLDRYLPARYPCPRCDKWSRAQFWVRNGVEWPRLRQRCLRLDDHRLARSE
jgi:hypothetical protein